MSKRLLKLKRRNRKLRRLDYETKMRENARLQEIPTADTPGVDGLPNSYEYCDRGPFDGVISGPLGKKVDGSKTPGRWFATAFDALLWAEEKYGVGRVRLLYPSLGEESARWVVLVKNLRR